MITQKILGSGSLVSTLSALVAGDVSLSKFSWAYDLKKIIAICNIWHDTGMTRLSRRDLFTVDHPSLGTVQWKGTFTEPLKGMDDTKEFFLWVNGDLILQSKPLMRNCSLVLIEWKAKAAAHLSETGPGSRKLIERFLGSV